MKKVYLGAGRDAQAGYINVDNYPFEGIDVVADITKGLPFDNDSIDYVFSQDFMEHLPTESKVFVINEIWRVLKPEGIMEHIIPNAGSRNDFGSPSHLSHWNLQQFEHFDVDSYRYGKDREYEGFKGGFKKITTELVNFQEEEGGYKKAQSIHVVYRKA